MADHYPNDYIDRVFYAWYEGGRKTGNDFINSLATWNGDKPTKTTLKGWINSFGWIERAEALDAEVSRTLDEKVIESRKRMYEQQVIIADELVAKGREFLNAEGKGIQSDNAAIRAIDLGLTTQRMTIGMAEAVAKISQMSDSQLTDNLLKLLGKKSEETVDAEIVDEE